MKKIFLICPVRNAIAEQKEKMEEYIKQQEQIGNKVYYPARDTNQLDDTGGWRICSDNKRAIRDADEVHIFWDDKSVGSIFDLGVAFALDKKLIVANPESIDISNTKSFHNVIDYWRKLSI